MTGLLVLTAVDGLAFVSWRCLWRAYHWNDRPER